VSRGSPLGDRRAGTGVPTARLPDDSGLGKAPFFGLQTGKLGVQEAKPFEHGCVHLFEAFFRKYPHGDHEQQHGLGRKLSPSFFPGSGLVQDSFHDLFRDHAMDETPPARIADLPQLLQLLQFRADNHKEAPFDESWRISTSSA